MVISWKRIDIILYLLIHVLINLICIENELIPNNGPATLKHYICVHVYTLEITFRNQKHNIIA
jgi:hypothetical protein